MHFCFLLRWLLPVLVAVLLFYLAGGLAPQKVLRHRRTDGSDALNASWDEGTDLVVVTSHFSEDLRWLEQAAWPVVVCSKRSESARCQHVPNKGKEVSSYLQFIVQNYEALPRRVAFIHGHESAWHQRRPDHLLDSIRRAQLSPCTYVTLNGTWIDDRHMRHPYMKHLHCIWDELFRPFLQRDAPTRLLHDCCAQFVVTRECIWRHPRAAYEHWLSFVLESQDQGSSGPLAYVFEYMWPVIFGEPDVVTKAHHRKACWL
jgi:hypothetical protein